MISKDHSLSMRKQCELLDIHRSRLFYKPIPKPDETELSNCIAEIYQRWPVYGYRRIENKLRERGLCINGKRILRIMRQMGLEAIYPKPSTTKRNPDHEIYPYLLRGMNITKPHQVWQTDLTYIRVAGGFMYLNALIDVYSRAIVGWTLSNSLDTQSCLKTHDKAIHLFGCPEIINSDQGCQYTSQSWTMALKKNGIRISMNGRGRSNDNAHIERLWRTIKYEGFVIYPFETISELKESLVDIVHWYNGDRPHSSLSGQTPQRVLEVEMDKREGEMDYAFATSVFPNRMIKGMSETLLV